MIKTKKERIRWQKRSKFCGLESQERKSTGFKHTRALAQKMSHDGSKSVSGWKLMPQDLVFGTGGLASAQTEYDKRGYPDTLPSRGMTAWGGGPQLCAVLKDPSENCSNDYAEKFKSCILKKWMLGTFKISCLSSLCQV